MTILKEAANILFACNISNFQSLERIPSTAGYHSIKLNF